MKPHKLTTEVNFTPSSWKINHDSKVVTCGSCFAEVLGSQLLESKFPVLNNPFGTIFNPLTIAKALALAVDGREPDPALYFQDSDGVWLHFDFHSSLWGVNRREFECLLIAKLQAVRSFLKSANLLVITLGSAYAYRHRGTNLIIGNCHKVASEQFLKELLNQDQIMIGFEGLVLKLQAFNRNLKVLITISPVRHTRDTLILNQVSKSTLRLISHKLSEKFKQVEYFPAYEIMIDELRDYRYYEADLIHPNKLAEGHIFNVFASAFLEPRAVDLMKEWQAISQMIRHQPLHGYTISYLQFLKIIQSRLLGITANLDVSRELSEVSRTIDEFPG